MASGLEDRLDDARAFGTAAGAAAVRSWRGWRLRMALTPADRRRILAELYPLAGQAGRWWFRFTLMLALSVLIAVFGLSLNSDAVIIGAMLIAPMMTPLIGVAAALVMAWPRRLAQSALAVAAGSAGTVGISFVVAWLLPAADRVLTPAVLSRTSPDLRDLAVALAAGAAGAYATARKDVSAALPGVAMAVALVPPLAATGFTLAAGRSDLAAGAFLLFAANLVAIVLVGAVVLVLSGFVPEGRLRAASARIRGGFAAAVVALVAVAVPLTAASLAGVRHAQLTQEVNQVVVTWLQPYPALTLTGASISGELVTVEITGSVSPPPAAGLTQALAGVLGRGAAVQVRWFQTTTAAAAHGSGSSAVTLAQLRPLVDSWLAKAPGGASSMQVVQLTSSGKAVSVELQGPAAPPPAATLAQAISTRVGRTITVSVTWRTAPAPAQSPAAQTEQARTIVSQWLASHPGLDELATTVAGGTVTIDLAGAQPPKGTASLRTSLSTQLGQDVTIVIRFARLKLLTP